MTIRRRAQGEAAGPGLPFADPTAAGKPAEHLADAAMSTEGSALDPLSSAADGESATGAVGVGGRDLAPPTAATSQPCVDGSGSRIPRRRDAGPDITDSERIAELLAEQQEAIRKAVASAPPLPPEIASHLRTLFGQIHITRDPR
jgi:hypothetical protein